MLAAAVAVGAVALSAGPTTVKLRNVVDSNVQQAVSDLKQLVRDNTK